MKHTSKTFEDLLSLAKKVDNQRSELIKTGEALSNLCLDFWWDARKNIMSRCLPLYAAYRSQAGMETIEDFFIKNKEQIEANILEVEKENKAKAEKAELIKRLNLSDEEKKLLGIENSN